MLFASLFKYWQSCRDSMNINLTFSWEETSITLLASVCVATHTHSHISPLCVTAQDLASFTSALNKTSFLSFLPTLRDKPSTIKDNCKS